MGLLRALREPRQRHNPGLPAISKRVSTTLRSILSKKTVSDETTQPAEDMKHNDSSDREASPPHKRDEMPAGGSLNFTGIDEGHEEQPVPPQPETGEKRKRPEIDGHDERPKSRASAKAKDERTLQWVQTNDFAPHVIDVSPNSPPHDLTAGRAVVFRMTWRYLPSTCGHGHSPLEKRRLAVRPLLASTWSSGRLAQHF